jgi:hypothetical protein
MFKMVFVMLAALMLVEASVLADWLPSQRQEFMTDCVPSCEANPTINPSHRYLCPDYCECVRRLNEPDMSPADFAEMDRDVSAGKMTPRLERFQTAFPTCSRRVFGV